MSLVAATYNEGGAKFSSADGPCGAKRPAEQRHRNQARQHQRGKCYLAQALHFGLKLLRLKRLVNLRAYCRVSSIAIVVCSA
jgi:hypothetical protein